MQEPKSSKRQEITPRAYRRAHGSTGERTGAQESEQEGRMDGWMDGGLRLDRDQTNTLTLARRLEI